MPKPSQTSNSIECNGLFKAQLDSLTESASVDHVGLKVLKVRLAIRRLSALNQAAEESTSPSRKQKVSVSCSMSLRVLPAMSWLWAIKVAILHPRRPHLHFLDFTITAEIC